jgi:hypothetical protein
MIYVSRRLANKGSKKLLFSGRAITYILTTVVGFVFVAVFVALAGNFSYYWAYKAFADHGREVLIELNSATYMPLTTAPGNQVKVGVNFSTLETTLIGSTINAVMKVYAPNTTAIKSTSFPSGFIANSSGIAEIKTTISNSSMQNVTAVVQFTDTSKTIPLSNPVQIGLNLTQGTSPMATPIEPEFEIAALPPE